MFYTDVIKFSAILLDHVFWTESTVSVGNSPPPTTHTMLTAWAILQLFVDCRQLTDVENEISGNGLIGRALTPCPL